MGCCLCRSESGVLEDPDVFHTEAKLVASIHSGDIAGFTSSDTRLLYVKNDKFYQVSPSCGLLCCSVPRKLSNIEDVRVITGTVKVISFQETRVLSTHHINLGLKMTVSNWYGERVKIYDTPDAVELARRLSPHLRGKTIIEPTRVNMTLRQPFKEPHEEHVGPNNYIF